MNSSADDATATMAQPGVRLGMFDLLEAARGIEERVNAALEALGLSMSKYMTLQHLIADGGGMSLSALADCRRCVRSNITQLVDRLVADGFVERVNDPSDRRTVRAQITELGAERFGAATSAMQTIQSELLGHLSTDEQAGFVKVLSALRSS